MTVKNDIKFLFRHAVLTVACFGFWQAQVAAAFEDQHPAPPEASSETPPVAKSGISDGQWSPALTGVRHPLYRLQKSDVLEIKFGFEPEFDQVLNILPDGYMVLKGVDELYADGMSLPELREAVLKAYSPVLRDPEISIFLRDFARPFFVAGGEVGRPGKYDLRTALTVAEAIAIAGGFTDRSKHSQVVLFRRVTPDIVESHVINLKAMLRSRNLGEDSSLMSGDLIFVPQNTLSKIKRFLPTSDMSLYSAPTKF